MSRAAAGAAFGAAGATAYLKPDLLIDWARKARPSLNTQELEHLSKLVEQLTSEVRASKSGITIIRTDNASDKQLLSYIIATLGVSGILYLAIFRGWRLSDLFYVTQRTFKQGINGLSTGLDALHARVADVKARLLARINEISNKQDEFSTVQIAMQSHLKDMAHDVDIVRSQVNDIHSAVFDMESTLTDVGAQQRHSLQGIYILCRAVSELMENSSIPSKADLVEFTKSSPVWQKIKPTTMGLESVLLSGSTYAYSGHKAPGTPSVGVSMRHSHTTNGHHHHHNNINNNSNINNSNNNSNINNNNINNQQHCEQELHQQHLEYAMHGFTTKTTPHISSAAPTSSSSNSRYPLRHGPPNEMEDPTNAWNRRFIDQEERAMQTICRPQTSSSVDHHAYTMPSFHMKPLPAEDVDFPRKN